MQLNDMVTPNNDHKIVRFTNIAHFDFTPEMGSMYGGVPYFVPAGKSLLMPLSVADHIATHLARQIIIQKAPIRDEKEVDGKGSDRKLWEPRHIDELKQQILSSEIYSEERPAPVTPEQVLARKVEDLNKEFPPEVIAAAARANTAPAPVAAPVAPTVVVEAPVVPAAPTVPPATFAPPATTTDTAPAPIIYKDKAEVIAELTKRQIKFDARKSKSDLEKLLETPAVAK